MHSLSDAAPTHTTTMPLLPERRNSTDFLSELTDWTDYKDDLLPYDEVGSTDATDFSPQKALSPAARTALSKALAEEHDSPVHKENSAGELGGRPSPAARKAVRRALDAGDGDLSAAAPIAEPEATAAALEKGFSFLGAPGNGSPDTPAAPAAAAAMRMKGGAPAAAPASSAPAEDPVVKAKNEGNRLFAANDLEAAEAAYSAGLRAEGAAGHAERGRLLINRAFARLKLASAEEHGVKKRRKLYNDCVNDCYDALHLQPDSTKALYRRARALLGLACAPLGVAGSTEQAEALAQAKEDLARVVRLDPANRDAAQWLEAAPLLVRRVDGGRRKLPAATDGLAAFRRAASNTAVVAADAADASSAALTWVYDNRGPVLTAAVILLLALLLPMAYSAVANLVAPPPPPPALTPPPPPPSPLDGVKDLAKGWLSGAKDLGAKAATEWRNEYNKLAKK